MLYTRWIANKIHLMDKLIVIVTKSWNIALKREMCDKLM